MEQKDYKLEIIGVLLRKEKHARAIAKILSTNHMMVVRKLKKLTEENAVDYNREGRNKVYFLKSGVEARNYAFIFENYKLSKFVKKHPKLRRIIDRIIENKKIRLAVIFGSYAKGTEGSKSDIDLYVDGSRKIKRELESFDSSLSLKLGAFDRKNPLIKEIEKNHVIVKGVEEYYEKSELFD
jgi:predicted nucleotidyltransferase